MEGASSTGVLGHLSLLEVQARSRKAQREQRSRVRELRAKVEALKIQRELLQAEIDAYKNLQKCRSLMEQQSTHEEEEEMNDDSENSQLLRLMARHEQLKDLLHGHHIIGGYDIVTRQGKRVCVSLATSYLGVFLETYNLEIDLKPTLRIIRHNIPPFIPLKSLEEQSSFQTDMRTFLDTLRQHLNAFAGRKQQLKLVKELHPSVEVMESNILCSMLVMLFTVPREETSVLCSLDYADHTRCLPTRVHLESEDKALPDSPEWKKICSLLMETPVHQVLITMKEMGTIM